MSRLRQEIGQSTISATRCDGDGFSQTYQFAEDFVGFHGHFPGFPILPAFVQILAAQMAIEERADEALTLQQVKRAKFMRTIRPCEDVVICWNQEEKNGSLISRVSVTASGEDAAVFVLHMGRE